MATVRTPNTVAMSGPFKETITERRQALESLRERIVGQESRRTVPDATEDIRPSAPHIVVVGNHKGGSGKSTIALHVLIALLQAGKRVASIDLDVHQQTLTHFIENRRQWGLQNNCGLVLPYHCSIERNANVWKRRDESVDLARFTDHLAELQENYDYIVVDTPGGFQELSLVAHSMANTLITPINDSLLDLDAIVTIDLKDQVPQPSQYAMTVARALEARKSVCGLTTDWIIIRNRTARLPSDNESQIEIVLAAMSAKLGCRVAKGLSERSIFRELFAAGLTALDLEVVSAPKRFSSLSFSARLEVRNLVGETRLLLRKNTDVLTESTPRSEVKRRNRAPSSEKNTRTLGLHSRTNSAPLCSRSKRA
jgi:chromosome partitioning protein